MSGASFLRLIAGVMLLIMAYTACTVTGINFDPKRSGDSFGRQYFVLLPTEANASLPVVHNLFISSRSTEVVKVNISRSDMTWEATVQPNIVANVTLNMTGYQFTPSGVVHRLNASDDVAVWVTLGGGDSILGGYRAIPREALGKNYVGVLYPSSAFHSEVVVFSPANETNEIALHRVNDNLTVSIDAKPSISPSTFNIPAMDSAKIVSASDLSGLELSSTQAVSVTSGRNCRTPTTPSAPSQCDNVMEQLTPLDAWGLSFVVVPQSKPAGTKKLRVVSAFSNTMFAAFSSSGHPGKTWTISGERAFIDVYTNVTRGRPFTLRADKPIFVTQFFTDWRMRQDYASMVTIPPVEQFTNGSITFPALNHTIYKNTLVVVTRCEHRSDLLLDNKEITTLFQYSVKFTVEPHSSVHGTYCTLNTTLRSGSHTIRLRDGANPGAVYSAILYGVGKTVSYAFPVANDVREIVCNVTGREIDLCNYYVPPDFTTPVIPTAAGTSGGPNHIIAVVVVLVVLSSLAIVIVVVIVLGNCTEHKGPRVAWRRFRNNENIHYDADFEDDDDEVDGVRIDNV